MQKEILEDDNIKGPYSNISPSDTISLVIGP
jgi:hypothetical protein